MTEVQIREPGVEVTDLGNGQWMLVGFREDVERAVHRLHVADRLAGTQGSAPRSRGRIAVTLRLRPGKPTVVAPRRITPGGIGAILAGGGVLLGGAGVLVWALAGLLVAAIGAVAVIAVIGMVAKTLLGGAGGSGGGATYKQEMHIHR
jgi:hypothetical protein